MERKGSHDDAFQMALPFKWRQLRDCPSMTLVVAALIESRAKNISGHRVPTNARFHAQEFFLR